MTAQTSITADLTSADAIPSTWESGDLASFVAHREAMAEARGWVPLMIDREIDGTWVREPDVDRTTGLQRYRSAGGAWRYYDIKYGYLLEGAFHRVSDRQGRRSLEVEVWFLGDAQAPLAQPQRLFPNRQRGIIEPVIVGGPDEETIVERLRSRFNAYCQAVCEGKAREYRESAAGAAQRARADAHGRSAVVVTAGAADRLCQRRDELARLDAERKRLRALCDAARDNDEDVTDLIAQRRELALRRERLCDQIEALERAAAGNAPWGEEAAK